jgi:hypothetical protein
MSNFNFSLENISSFEIAKNNKVLIKENKKLQKENEGLRNFIKHQEEEFCDLHWSRCCRCFIWKKHHIMTGMCPHICEGRGYDEYTGAMCNECLYSEGMEQQLFGIVVCQNCIDKGIEHYFMLDED